MTAAEVNALTSQWLPLARGLARKAGQRYPWLCHDFESEAAEALLKLAQRFGGDGNDHFPGLVRKGVRWAILKRLARERSRNPLAFRPQIDTRDDEGELLDVVTRLADDSPPVGADVDDADELRAVLDRAGLTERQRDVFVRFVGGEEDSAAIAADEGVCAQRIRQIAKAALAKLKDVTEMTG